MTELSSLIGWATETLRNVPQNRVRVRVRVRASVRVRLRFRVRSPFRYKLQTLFLLPGVMFGRYLLQT